MWKPCWIDLVVNVAVVDRVNVDSSVKRNTNIVDVVGGIKDATFIKKIVAHVIHTPNEWLEIIHDERRQEKA